MRDSYAPECHPKRRKEAGNVNVTCFDHFPEPVFYIQDGTLRYSNAAALVLEPEWTAGAPVPESLA